MSMPPPPPPPPPTPAPVRVTMAPIYVMPMPHTYLGCFRDNKMDRVLSGSSSGGTPGMTIQMCADFCNGYAYFGTEFGEECFCGPSSDQPERLGGGTCDRDCSGNAMEICGGYDAISVYEYDDSPSPAPEYLGCYKDRQDERIMEHEESRSDMTPQVCEGLCTGKSFFGTQYGRECWCGDEHTDYARHGASSSCTHECAGDDNQRCGGTNAMDCYKYSTTSVPPPPIRHGCFKDRSTDRIMDRAESSSDMTNERCEDICDGHAFFGTQYGRECWCGDEWTEIDKHGPSDDCTYECEGDRDEICGGRDAMTVWEY